MKSLTGRRRRFGYVVVVVGLAAAFPLTSPRLYTLKLASGMFMYVALAQSWNIMGGYTGYLNLGHVVFFGVGAYASGVLSAYHDVPALAVAPFGGVLAVVVAAVIGYPTLRLRGPYFAVLTLALVSVARLATQNITQFGGGLGIILPRVPFELRRNEELFYWLFLAVAMVVVMAAYLIEKSRFGLSMVAIRNDEEAARVFGVDTTKTKMIALMASAFPAGLCGSIFAYQLGYIEPAIVFDIGMSITFVLMVMLGGPGRWVGPIVGAVIVYLLTQTLVLVIADELNRVLFGLILIGVIYTMPSGVLGLVTKARDWLGTRATKGRRFVTQSKSSSDEVSVPAGEHVPVGSRPERPLRTGED